MFWAPRTCLKYSVGLYQTFYCPCHLSSFQLFSWKRIHRPHHAECPGWGHGSLGSEGGASRNVRTFILYQVGHPIPSLQFYLTPCLGGWEAGRGLMTIPNDGFFSLQKRCPTASSPTESHGNWSRGCPRGSSQGERNWRKRNLLQNLSNSLGDRCWGGAEGKQCSEAGGRGHPAISSRAPGQRRNISYQWENIW